MQWKYSLKCFLDEGCHNMTHHQSWPRRLSVLLRRWWYSGSTSRRCCGQSPSGPGSYSLDLWVLFEAGKMNKKSRTDNLRSKFTLFQSVWNLQTCSRILRAKEPTFNYLFSKQHYKKKEAVHEYFTKGRAWPNSKVIKVSCWYGTQEYRSMIMVKCHSMKKKKNVLTV